MKIRTILINQKLMKSAFSIWLKKHREESGLTLIQLRDKIGKLCSDAYLSKLENDKYKGKKGKPAQPDIEIVEALALAFNRPIDEARLAAGYAPKNPDLPHNDKLMHLAFAYPGIPEEDRNEPDYLIDILEREIQRRLAIEKDKGG